MHKNRQKQAGPVNSPVTALSCTSVSNDSWSAGGSCTGFTARCHECNHMHVPCCRSTCHLQSLDSIQNKNTRTRAQQASAGFVWGRLWGPGLVPWRPRWRGSPRQRWPSGHTAAGVRAQCRAWEEIRGRQESSERWAGHLGDGFGGGGGWKRSVGAGVARTRWHHPHVITWRHCGVLIDHNCN